MPQINRIRVNNVKYNFGTQYYDDFMMRFHGKNTIYDLANGGGKSLLMLLLLQNIIPNCTLDEKQPIEKLFRAGCDNTVIHSLIEWKLDPCYQKDNYKYMTTGFCARKGHQQETQENILPAQETAASVEYFNYCIFYRNFGDNDIKNLPLVHENERVTYNGLKAYLRELERKDFHVAVHIFERKGDYQQFISQFGIFESEWEIIRGINKTEGHVRTYFETNYRTSRKVVEDLLIEEIIQKSIQNKTAAQDDDSNMAQTLLDIKDKLLELSRKNAQIANFTHQISALEKFSDYVKSFQEMYEGKERLKQQLYDMLIACKQMLITYEQKSTSVENYIEEMQVRREDEQRRIQTAQVLEEQESKKNMESLIAQAQQKHTALQAEYDARQKKLMYAEAAKEYQDYVGYEQSAAQVQVVLQNQTKDNAQLLHEIGCVVAAYNKLQETERRQTKEQLLHCTGEKSSLEEQYEQERTQQKQAVEERAGAEGKMRYITQEISNLEQELSVHMEQAGLLIAEEAQAKLERAAHEQQEAKARQAECQKRAEQAERAVVQAQTATAKSQAMYEYLMQKKKELSVEQGYAQEEIERLDNLKQIYLQQDAAALAEVILHTYQQLVNDIQELTQKKTRLEQFEKSLKNRQFILDAPMRNQLKNYLNTYYPGCVIEGADWLAQLPQQVKQNVYKVIPFAEYALVFTKDFDRARQDKMLLQMQMEAYVVPLINHAIADKIQEDAQEEMKQAYVLDIAFARKDLAFLSDDVKCQAEEKKIQEEIDTVALQILSLEDRRDAVWQDYLFVQTQQLTQASQVREQIEMLTEQLAQYQQQIQEAKQQSEQEGVLLQQANTECEENNKQIQQAQEAARMYTRIVELSERVSVAYQNRDEQQRLVTEYTNEAQTKETACKKIKDALEHCILQERQLLTQLESDRQLLAKMQPYRIENVAAEDADIQAGKEALETKFYGLQEALDKEHSDVSDKQALLHHYQTSMDKCKEAVAYRGLVWEDVAQQMQAGTLFVQDTYALGEYKKQLAQIQDELRSIEQELDAQNALYNRLEGSITHGIGQIEAKFGVFEAFDCENFDQYIKQHTALVQDMAKKLSEEKVHLQNVHKEVNRLSVIEKDLQRIVTAAQMEVPERIQADEREVSLDFEKYETIQKDYDKLIRLEFRKQNEFGRHKMALIEQLNRLEGTELAQEVRVSVHIPQDAAQTKQLVEHITETNTFIALEKDRVAKGIEDMEKIKESFENRCIQICCNIKTELDRLPKLSNITMDNESIAIIGLQIPYIREEAYHDKMSAYIDDTIRIAERYDTATERFKYIRGRLVWKNLFSVIVTDMNLARIQLYKRERIRQQSRYLRYEEAVGSTGQSQGIYIQFLIAIINYISSINAPAQEAGSIGKTLFIDNPFGAAKDIYIWEPIFALLKTNHVQLIVPARGATPAITGRFEVNYILGQKMTDDRAQTVVVDYYSQTSQEELEYTRMEYEQATLQF